MLRNIFCGFYFIWAPFSALRSRFFARRSSSQKELHSGRGASRYRKFATISKFSVPEKFPAKTPKFLDLYFRKNLAKTLNFQLLWFICRQTRCFLDFLNHFFATHQISTFCG
jgi:hypothetical protein